MTYQLDLFVLYSTWQPDAQQSWKWACIKFGNTLDGRRNRKGLVWGGITVSGGCRGIHGQSCLASDHSTVREAKPSSGWGGPWLNVCLNPLTSFQSKLFARAYRISAWSHGRARLPLGKADTTQWLSEAELNRPRSPCRAEEGRSESRLTQNPLGRGAEGYAWHREKYVWNTYSTYCILSAVNTLNGMMRVNWVLRTQTFQGWYDMDSTKTGHHGTPLLLKHNLKTSTIWEYTKKATRPS